MSAWPFMTSDEAAAWLRTSRRCVHEFTRANAIPHFKCPGGRRCLFRLDWLEGWAEGAPLEVIELTGGERTVRPRESQRSRSRTAAQPAKIGRPTRPRSLAPSPPCGEE
jgi:excisionase family DNA binding protein